MADSGQPSTYACKCLNVRIYATSPPAPPPEPRDNAFVPVFVDGEGIRVTHIQLTLRNKGPRAERKNGDKTEDQRMVSLTCLICETLVYRISQTILSNVDSVEGPVLPTEEWVEKEILKSSDGWLEVSKDALAGKAVEEAEASPQYSKTFNVILSEQQIYEHREGLGLLPESKPERSHSPDIPEKILPNLPDLFPPPPFTPSHPAFTHLSAVATAESEKLRAATEEYLQRVLREKVAELQATEAKLKSDVEKLWANFRNVVNRLEEGGDVPAPHLRLKTRRSSSRGRGNNPSVRMTDFVPAASTPPRQTHRPVSTTAPSALSASLANSNLQSFMQGRIRDSSPSTSSRSPTRVAHTGSPSTASSKTLGMPINGEAEIREAHRRNMNEQLDMATSYRYMMDLAEHMEAARAPAPIEEVDEPDETSELPSPPTAAVPRGRSPRTSKSAIKKPKLNGNAAPAPEAGSPVRQGAENGAPKETETTPTKGKRKVTFDVEPDVAIIPGPSPPKGSPPRVRRAEAEVFDMEGETLNGDVDTAGPVSAVSPPPEPPVVQEPIRLARRQHRRQISGSGLPASFSSLRPASLPAPSAMRRVAAFDKPDDRSRAQAIRDSVLSPPVEVDVKRRDVVDEPLEMPQDEEEVHDAREAEILRLVAASMPSHRSAWKKDSSAWRQFVGRQKATDYGRATIPEEDESSTAEGSAYYDESTDSSNLEEESQVNNWAGGTVMAKSLPIPIGPLGSARPSNGLPPFSKNDPVTEKVSAAAMRRASYRERDRMRAIDPGALDFDVEDDLEEELINATDNDGEVGGKSMQRALNILQKHSEIPGAGMWRSLA